MSFKCVLKNIGRFATLTPEEEEAFSALLTIKKLKKKEFLLREGNLCNHEYYVNSGCLRAYYTDKKGVEHNLYFAIEDWWISDLYSRTRKAPSFVNIVGLEDAELVQISQTDLERSLEKIPALERFFRVSYQESLVNQHLKNLQMLYMSGEERYIHFRERYPKMADRISQMHIASFLGMTPQYFNKIHAKVLRDHC